MNKLQEGLSQYWLKIQGSLFPWLSEELGEGMAKRQQLVMILEVIRVEDYLSVTLGLGMPRIPGVNHLAAVRALKKQSFL